jgi:hypothetical protein
MQLRVRGKVFHAPDRIANHDHLLLVLALARRPSLHQMTMTAALRLAVQLAPACMSCARSLWR